jgi:hypothetical protein
MGIILYHENEPYKEIGDHIILLGAVLGVFIAYDCRVYLWVFQVLMVVIFVFSIHASLIEEIPVVLFFMFLFSFAAKYKIDRDGTLY